jgi:hypothetical protein
MMRLRRAALITALSVLTLASMPATASAWCCGRTHMKSGWTETRPNIGVRSPGIRWPTTAAKSDCESR